MKHKQELEVSFAGNEDKNNTVEKETQKPTPDELKQALASKENQTLIVESGVEQVLNVSDAEPLNDNDSATANEALDPYSKAIDELFAGYQTFQEGMQKLSKLPNPRFLMAKLTETLDGFKKVIAEFKEAEFEVPAEFQAGHDFVLEAISKYDVFLVDYPAVVTGKGGLKAMKKVAKLGKLSADADQDMKKAFRAFDEATQGA